MQTKTYHNSLSPSETLEEAIRVIGYKPVTNKPTQKGWITFWCPFHDDIGRKGHSGRPNFGLNVESGGWTCFVCGRSGGSLAKIGKRAGERVRSSHHPRQPDVLCTRSRESRELRFRSVGCVQGELHTFSRQGIRQGPRSQTVGCCDLWLGVWNTQPGCRSWHIPSRS